MFLFSNFQNIDSQDTYDNPKGFLNYYKGLVAISADKNSTTIAFPDKNKGYVRVKSYEKNTSVVISAHESVIACLSLSYDGSILATASDKVIFC